MHCRGGSSQFSRLNEKSFLPDSDFTFHIFQCLRFIQNTWTVGSHTQTLIMFSPGLLASSPLPYSCPCCRRCSPSPCPSAVALPARSSHADLAHRFNISHSMLPISTFPFNSFNILNAKYWGCLKKLLNIEDNERTGIKCVRSIYSIWWDGDNPHREGIFPPKLDAIHMNFHQNEDRSGSDSSQPF